MNATDSLTVRCAHCGPITVEDRGTLLRMRSILAGLRDGHAPLAAITCPRCHDEIRSQDVSDSRVDPWLCESGAR